MGSESDAVHPMNIVDVLKKVLLTFVEVNVKYVRGLDIYGSIHVRSDDIDVISCVLNEHCYKKNKPANVEDREQITLLAGNLSTQQGASLSNASSGNEFLPDWMGQAIGGKKFSPKKGTFVSPGLGKGEISNDETESLSKRKKTTGLSRKLSKLNRTSSLNLQYPAQSVFPEPMPFGRDNENERMSPEDKHSSLTDRSQESENTESVKLRQKLEEQGGTDDPGNDSTTATEGESAPKTGCKFEHSAEGSELADLDSGDSQDFEQADKAVSFPFSSQQQSFNHSTCFAGFQLPSVGFNESEIFSQTAWLQADISSRGGNQVAGTDSSFDGFNKTTGSLAQEKICGYCLKIFHSNVELSQHIQQLHNSGFPMLDNTEERPYRPRYQNTYAYGASELDLDRQLTCSVCSLSFRSLDGLRCHENSKHSRNKLYKCQFCTQSFLTRQAAYTHRMKFHRLIPRKLQPTAGPMTPI